MAFCCRGEPDYGERRGLAGTKPLTFILEKVFFEGLMLIFLAGFFSSSPPSFNASSLGGMFLDEVFFPGGNILPDDFFVGVFEGD